VTSRSRRYGHHGPAGSTVVDVSDNNLVYDALDEGRLLLHESDAASWIEPTDEHARLAVLERDLSLLLRDPDTPPTLTAAAQLELAIQYSVIGQHAPARHLANIAEPLLDPLDDRAALDLLESASKHGLVGPRPPRQWRRGFGSSLGTQDAVEDRSLPTFRSGATTAPEVDLVDRDRINLRSGETTLELWRSDVAALAGSAHADIRVDGNIVHVDLGVGPIGSGVLHLVVYKEQELVGEGTLVLEHARERSLPVAGDPTAITHLHIQVPHATLNPLSTAREALRLERIHDDDGARAWWLDASAAWLGLGHDRCAALSLWRRAEIGGPTGDRSRARLLHPDLDPSFRFGRIESIRWRAIGRRR